MNVAKTEVISMSRREVEPLQIEIGAGRVGNAENFKYLGCILNKQGVSSMEVTERIKKFSRSVGALYHLLKEREIPLEPKKIIFETVFTLILTYGAESLTIGGKDRSRIQAAEMRPLRTMVGKTKRDILGMKISEREIGVCPVLNKVDSSQLRWLGHLERMEDGRLIRD